MAPQMAEALLERTVVKISNDENSKVFTANGEVITFEGFLKIYLEGTDDDDDEQAGMLPKLAVGESLTNIFITATERYSKPPY